VDKGGLAGFDTSGVQKPPEFQGKMEFEVSPETVRAGDSYTISIFLRNDGDKSVKIQSLTADAFVNGVRSKATARLRNRNVKSGRRVLVGEVAGVWEASSERWVLAVTATSDKGETYRSRLKAN
jgi:hypothetical protein